MSSVHQCQDTGSASPAPGSTSRAGGVMGKCTAPVESAVLWIILPTVPLGLSCREKSPPYWAPVEQEPRRPLRLEPGLHLGQVLQVHLHPGLEAVLQEVEAQLEVETSPSRRRERRDGGFSGNQDPNTHDRVVSYEKEMSAPGS